MATIGKAFTFRVYCAADHTDKTFEFILSENGWLIGDYRGTEDFDSHGPKALVQTTGSTLLPLPDTTRQALALLHESHSALSDRIFQTRLSTIATAMSEALKDAQLAH